MLELAPADLSAASQRWLAEDLSGNIFVTTVSLSRALEPTVRVASARNSCAAELVDSLAHIPFTRGFRCKINSYKSVKGRQMVWHALHHERILESAVFARPRRAATIEVDEDHAEMVGRRPQMEDVSVVLVDRPAHGALLFALFDGRGGCEPPAAIAERATDGLEAACTGAFAQVQSDMQSWCAYVGTTVVLAIIDANVLTDANVGDSRCVLLRDGRAVRLTVDHNPDVPEEARRIRQGRKGRRNAWRLRRPAA
jgi:hypothetical protein